jgi:hypothetical protein
MIDMDKTGHSIETGQRASLPLQLYHLEKPDMAELIINLRPSYPAK